MKVYFSGFNEFQQLRQINENNEIGTESFILGPTEIWELNGKTVVDICITWSRLIVLLEDCILIYGFWDNKSSVNIIDSKSLQLSKICCTNTLLVGINTHGKLLKANYKAESFVWEQVMVECSSSESDISSVKFMKVTCNERDVLGLDREGNIYLLPTKIDSFGVKFADIACGREHFIALSTDGMVYTWGSGRRGQLGHGDVNSSDYPLLVEALGGIKVVQIAAGGWHSGVIGESGEIYTWGWNESGQLGWPNRDARENNSSGDYVSLLAEPRLLDCIEPFSTGEMNVTSISCGTRHTTVILDDKSSWAWGWNGYGQLGTKDRRSRHQPVRVIQDVDKVICGSWNTVWFSH